MRRSDRLSVWGVVLPFSAALLLIAGCRTAPYENDNDIASSGAYLEGGSERAGGLPPSGFDTEDNKGGTVKPFDEQAEQAAAATEGDSEMFVTDDVEIDELGDEGAVADADTFGAAGDRAGSCGLTAETMSAGAVGDPCMTSVEFMRSLGLSDQQIAWVQDHSTTTAH